jgi:hypothetical protein
MQGKEFKIYLSSQTLPISSSTGKATYSILVVGAVSMPATNYSADYLPLSIGLQVKKQPH